MRSAVVEHLVVRSGQARGHPVDQRALEARDLVGAAAERGPRARVVDQHVVEVIGDRVVGIGDQRMQPRQPGSVGLVEGDVALDLLEVGHVGATPRRPCGSPRRRPSGAPRCTRAAGTGSCATLMSSISAAFEVEPPVASSVFRIA